MRLSGSMQQRRALAETMDANAKLKAQTDALSASRKQSEEDNVILEALATDAYVVLSTLEYRIVADGSWVCPSCGGAKDKHASTCPLFGILTRLNMYLKEREQRYRP